MSPAAPDAAAARLARRLRLEAVPGAAGARLAALQRDESSLLWLVFRDARGGEAWIGAAAAGGKPWAFNGRTLKLCHRIGQEESGLRRLALERCAERLDGIPFARLAGPAARPRRPAPPARRREPPAPPGPRGPHFQEGSHPDRWREFCWFTAAAESPGETFLGALSLGAASRILRYGDLECQFSHRSLDGVSQGPWTFIKDPVAGAQERLVLMDDRDLIHGTGARKVERLLRGLAAERGGGLQFFNCCVPMMTGDDVRGPLERFSRRTGRTVVYSDMSPLRCSYISLTGQIREALAPRPGRAPRRRPGRYALAGFRPGRGRDELTALLAEAGAEPGLAVLPEFDLDSLARYPEASAQALMPNRYYAEIYGLLEGLGLPTLKDCAPFGLEGSLLWLRQLGILLGGRVPARLARVLARTRQALAPRWRELARQARAYRVGFVLGPGDAARLADPALSGGACVPLLAAEMGFAIDLLVFQGGTDAAAELKAARRLLAGLPGAARHAVLPFRDRAGLRARLRSGRLALAYSNVRRDLRLTRSGIAAFSLRDLEPGPAGAVRGAERLVERCRLPYFRDLAGVRGG
jgi:hypothetical protein